MGIRMNLRNSNKNIAFLSGSAFTILAPEYQTAPIVFASPHSGSDYPEEFLLLSCLDPLTLRRSEDAFVDELFGQVYRLGAPLLAAQFPRVYVDANREIDELDPSMFNGDLPENMNTRSLRVLAGLGTIAKIVSDGQEIYNSSLRYTDIKRRIEQCYIPYHRALRGLVESTIRRFGICLIIDCHSMPSNRYLPRGVQDDNPANLVLGDCWGGSCDRSITDAVEKCAREQGFSVKRNVPYAGGFTTQHYGSPSSGIHALQLEIDRSMYMNELSIERLPEFDDVCQKLTVLSACLTAMGWSKIAAE